jgi:mannose-1-phosphate guanylyltransferase/phosphomannomutase
MRSCLEEAKGKRSELIDGVKIFVKNGWVLMLPDPDEAFFHIWAESDDEKTAKELLHEYTAKVKSWQV